MACHGMHPDGISIADTARAFAAEMALGRAARPSSFAMLPSHLPKFKTIPEAGAQAIVIDAGGTHLRVCRVLFDANGNAEILDLQAGPIPGSGGVEISADAFFEGIAKAVSPCLNAVPNAPVGFCFSYPAQVQPDLDARVVSLGKEVRVRGIEGASLRAGLLKHLATKPAKITVLNDAVAALWGGDNAHMSLIVGTGSNSAYYERDAVNIESGCFDKFPRGDFDLAFDAASAQPGRGVFEKTLGGAYLGSLASDVLRGAANEGLTSNAAPVFTPREMDEMLMSGARTFEAFVFDLLYERAAKLLAANILGVFSHTRQNAGNVCIEGSTLRKSQPLLSKLRSHLPAHIQLTQTDHCVAIGTARAALHT